MITMVVLMKKDCRRYGRKQGVCQEADAAIQVREDGTLDPDGQWWVLDILES